MIVALAGGVGGARLAAGLATVLPSRSVSFVVNTGDDFEHLGLSICPDLDTVMYTLAGVNDSKQGWGRASETWNFMSALTELGGEHWFRLGDRDLAVHVLRTTALAKGDTLAEVTRMLCRRFGIRHAIYPVSDDSLRTRVRTDSGTLDFQDYFVRRRCRPKVTGFQYSGSRNASVPPALQSMMRSGIVRGVVICPSNPYVSIEPILQVRAIRDWLRQRNFPVVAVSPIIGGKALKGPAAKMMRELGADVSALGVAQHYRKWVDGWVIDKLDAKYQSAVAAMCSSVLVTDTIMRNRRGSARLAGHTIKLLDFLGHPGRGDER
jgi:LPPG:FO 2-phospho-L-lactate transferase